MAIVQFDEKALRKVIRQEMDLKPRTEYISMREAKKRLGKTYDQLRYMREETHIDLFRKKEGRQWELNYTAFLQSA